MAKYTRFDPRNKKRNKHKNRVKQSGSERKIRFVGKPSNAEEYV